MGTHRTGPDEAWDFAGPVRFLAAATAFITPDGFLTSAKVATAADLDADKLEHRHSIVSQQVGGTDVVSRTEFVHIARAAGTLKRFDVRPITSPTGGDKQYTVDIQKVPDASDSATSLLSAAVTIDDDSVDNTKQAGTPSGTPTYAAGDLIQIVVTASGSTGSQGQGFIAEADLDESGA